jgi:hypothetical protein
MINSLKKFLHTVSFGRLFPNLGQENTELTDGNVTSVQAEFPHELNLRELTTGLQNVAKVQTPKLIRDYDEQKGFRPLIQEVIMKIKASWEEWERTYCSDLRDAEALLREEKAKNQLRVKETEFQQMLAERNNSLLDDLKNAFRVRESNKTRAKTVKQRYKEVLDELETMRVAFTGDINKSLGGNSSIWSSLVIVFFVLGIGAVENILGFGTFKFESDTMTAFALSTTVVAVFTSMTYLGATGGSKLLANKDAHRRFYSTYRSERTYPKDRFDNPVVPHPPSLSAWAQFILGTGLFLLASVILLVGRIGIIQKMSSDDSSMYLAGAIALIFLNFILYIYKLLYGAKYESSDIASYQSLEQERDQLKEEKQSIHPDAYLALIDDALVNYEADIADAKGDIQTTVDYLRGLVYSYRDLHNQYKEGWIKTKDFFRQSLRELGRAAIREDISENSVKSALDDAYDSHVADLELTVIRPLENDIFLGQIMDWVPSTAVIDEANRITEFADLIQHVENDVVEEARRQSSHDSDSAELFDIRVR